MADLSKSHEAETHVDEGSRQNQDNIIHVQSPLLRVNADNQEPLQYGCLWFILSLLIILIFLLALALPDVFSIKTNVQAYFGNEQVCRNPKGFDGNQFVYCEQFSSSNPTVGLILKGVDNLNQFGAYYLEFNVQRRQLQSFNISQNVTFQLYGVEPVSITKQSTSEIAYRYRQTIFQEQLHFQLTADKDSDDDDRDGDKGLDRANPNRQDDRRSEIWKQLVFQRDFSQSKYYLASLKFENSNQLNNVENVEMLAATINPDFTKFTIIVRYVYLGIALITGIIFLRRYFQLKQKQRIVQIRILAITSVMLVFFNDPLNAVTILLPNPVTTFFSIFFVVNFEICLYGLFIFFLSRIYFQGSTKQSTILTIRESWPKFLLLTLIYIFSLVVFLSYAYFAFHHSPLVQNQDLQKPQFVVPLIILIFLIIAASIWIVTLFVMSCVKACSQTLLWREKQLLIMVPFFFILFTISMVAESTKPYYYSHALWVLYAYSFQNIFIYLLQFMYYTPKHQLEQARQNQQILSENHSINSEIQIGDKQLN